MTLARPRLNHQNAAALRLHAALARQEELNAWLQQRVGRLQRQPSIDVIWQVRMTLTVFLPRRAQETRKTRRPALGSPRPESAEEPPGCDPGAAS